MLKKFDTFGCFNQVFIMLAFYIACIKCFLFCTGSNCSSLVFYIGSKFRCLLFSTGFTLTNLLFYYWSSLKNMGCFWSDVLKLITVFLFFCLDCTICISLVFYSCHFGPYLFNYIFWDVRKLLL